jgi:hypothetical protein
VNRVAFWMHHQVKLGFDELSAKKCSLERSPNQVLEAKLRSRICKLCHKLRLRIASSGTQF